ncbi:MAG TPA: heme-binding protein [Stellaceae bacterium]|jgi:uncharacterized protein GlcG (DUF336 family)|nr:heme-binding protein [Stellaceae bacterium]
MTLYSGPELTLDDARKLIRRAVAKAEDLSASGAFVVVNDGGVPISASRMDRAGAFGIPVSRAKAFVAGAGHETSATFAGRQAGNFLGIFLSYQQLARDRVFPGPGAFLIRANGTIIGAMSTGAGIGPFVKWPGLSDPMKLVVDGKPANLEDLVISYALNEPYQPQHGDDAKRWIDAYGSLPSGTGTGLAEATAARKQTVLDTALRLSDAAMAEARRTQAAIAIAIVDRNGDVLQIDRMDDAPPMSPDIAEAVAVTAVNFQGPSERAAQPQFAHIIEAAPFKFLPLAGGLPIKDGVRVVGGIGIGGSDPEMCAAIAAKAIAAL